MISISFPLLVFPYFFPLSVCLFEIVSTAGAVIDHRHVDRILHPYELSLR